MQKRPKRVKELSRKQVKRLIDHLVNEAGVQVFLDPFGGDWYPAPDGLHNVEFDWDYGDDEGYFHTYRKYDDYHKFAIRDDGAILFIRYYPKDGKFRAPSKIDTVYPIRYVQAKELIEICESQK